MIILKIYRIIGLILWIPIVGYTQDPVKENLYNTINENDLEIIHQGRSVDYGEDFTSVSRKWTDAR